MRQHNTKERANDALARNLSSAGTQAKRTGG
jgi:hypothetical protein